MNFVADLLYMVLDPRVSPWPRRLSAALLRGVAGRVLAVLRRWLRRR